MKKAAFPAGSAAIVVRSEHKDNETDCCPQPRPLAEVADRVVRDARLRRKARQLYDRPPRLMVEAVVALADLAGDRGATERVIDNLLAVPDEILAALGGEDIPTPPIRVVQP